MSYSIKLTEEQISSLIENIKDNEQLCSSIKEQKDKVVNARKRKRDEIKVKETVETMIENILAEWSGFISDRYRHISKIQNYFLNIYPEFYDKNVSKIKEHLKEIDRMNSEELKIVQKKILDMYNCDDSLHPQLSEGFNHVSGSHPVYFKYAPRLHNAILLMLDVEEYLRKYSADQLDDLTMEDNYDEIVGILFGHNEQLKALSKHIFDSHFHI